MLFIVLVISQLSFDTVRLTLYFPGVLYLIVGFCSFDDDGVPPGNDHDQVVGFWVERSVK